MLRSSTSYNDPGESTSSTTPQHTTTTLYDGQFLAKNKWSQNQRARLVIDYLDGKADFVNLCTKQLAALCRVRLSLVQQMRNGNGKRKNGNGSLAEHLVNATPAERVEAARVLGVDQVWDQMVLPIISEKRTAVE